MMATQVLPLSYTNEDIIELETLLGETNNQYLKEMLTQHLRDIQSFIHKSPLDQSEPKKINYELLAWETIHNYSWADVRNDAIKIWINLEGVHKIPRENISYEILDEEKTMGQALEFSIVGFKGKNHKLKIPRLYKRIKGIQWNVKKDKVGFYLLKEEVDECWPILLHWEPKAEKKSSKKKAETDMELMKMMYKDGDNELKQMIEKSITEDIASKTKKGPEPSKSMISNTSPLDTK